EYMLWNNVETKPYGFFPQGWDVQLLDRLGVVKWDGQTYEGQTVFESAPTGERVNGWLPMAEDWAHPNVGEDEPAGAVERGTYIDRLPHDTWFSYLARICNHCTYPACVAACPRQAIYKRSEERRVGKECRCRWSAHH